MTDSEKLDLLLADMQGMKNDMQDLKNDTKELKDKVSSIETKVNKIELTIENEIRVNIKRVAEGHLDLSRNLHEALKIDSEKEMLSIRVTMLEADVRKIKDQLEHIA